jgi:putative ABC transport system permease protein
MARIAVRSLWERKLRTALTALAIVLGVMMVAATYVLTDTIDRSFDDIFTTTNEGVDAVVTKEEVIETDDGQLPPFAAEILDQVRTVDGVGFAEGSIADPQVSIIGADGEPRGGSGAPSFGFSAGSDQFDPLTYEDGGLPQTDDQVVIDKASADAEGFQVGDTIEIAGKEAVKEYELVGIATLGGFDSLGGATFTLFTLPEAQRITGKEGQFDTIQIAAAEGVTPEQLAANLSASLPASVQVETGEQNVETQREDVGEFIDILRTALFIFAGVALFVGSFLIFNTFSITVAQRTREFAMLRTLGAKRRQILGTVITEALITGLVAAAIGILVGIGFAEAIKALFKAAEIDLPATGTVVKPRTIIVGLLIGTIVTTIAALIPAVRATRIPPVTGLREGAVVATARERRLRIAIGAALTIVGVAVMLLGLFGALDPGEVAVGLGAAAVFIGVTLLSPRLVTPLASAVGRPLERLRGVPGRLARENAVRNPNRTAATAAALMVGLALVSFVAVFAAGLRGSIDDAIDSTLTGDLIVSNEDGFSDIPAAITSAVAAVDGVEVASPARSTQDEVKGIGDGYLTLVDPLTAADVLSLDWQQGSQDLLANLGTTNAVIDEAWGDDNGLGVGDTFEALTASGETITYTVTGTFKDTTDFIGNYAASGRNAEAYGEDQNVSNVYLTLDDAADPDEVRANLDETLDAQFPLAKSESPEQLKDTIAGEIETLLNVIYALLALSVIVSLFGIVNTLALSIHERTRELGLLRAVGTSRRQVRQMVRYESVITALIGGLLGAILGVIFAVVISRPLADEGFILSIPVGTLIVLLVLTILAGVLAAIGPARRASRLDVLKALAYE